ncbi:MAG: hypothetical protein Q9159_001638 [Coniocarpon cinnabarinum]
MPRQQLKSPEVYLFIVRYNDEADSPLPIKALADATDVPKTTLNRHLDAAKRKLADEKAGIFDDEIAGDASGPGDGQSVKNVPKSSAKKGAVQKAKGESDTKNESASSKKGTGKANTDKNSDTIGGGQNVAAQKGERSGGKKKEVSGTRPVQKRKAIDPADRDTSDATRFKSGRDLAEAMKAKSQAKKKQKVADDQTSIKRESSDESGSPEATRNAVSKQAHNEKAPSSKSSPTSGSKIYKDTSDDPNSESDGDVESKAETADGARRNGGNESRLSTNGKMSEGSEVGNSTGEDEVAV